MNKVRILYVEDETTLARITGDVLRRKDFYVVVASDGVCALEAFKKEPFDVCVVDIMLPKLDGYSLVKKIRELNTTIPVIFLTARVLTDDVVKGYEMGGNDYLKKPFSIEELIVRINELVKRSTISTATHLYELGAYIFDHRKMTLKHLAETITLTHRESEIIQRLAERKNEIVTTQQLLMDLWGDDSFYNARSLNVFMVRIRKYFSHDRNVSIVNVRSVGYKMIV